MTYSDGDCSDFSEDDYIDGITGDRGGAKGYASGPVRALMSAVLFDGVQSYMSYLFKDGKSSKSEHKEALNWINDSTAGKDYIFSFNSVCEGLGIDPGCLREALIDIQDEDSDFSWGDLRKKF